jgi:hypothetical protein
MSISELLIFSIISGEEEVTYAPFIEVIIYHFPLKYLVIIKKILVEEHQRLHPVWSARDKRLNVNDS